MSNPSKLSRRFNQTCDDERSDESKSVRIDDGYETSTTSSGYGDIVSEDEEENSKERSNESQSQKKVEVDELLFNEDVKLSSTSSSSYNHQQHRPLDNSNRGMRLLMKMGWKEGTGLGANNSGRKSPVPTPTQTPLLGLGKSTQDSYMLDNTISKSKELESIVIAHETEEDRLKREEKVRVVQLREEERGDRLKSFYCSICDKGYTTIRQFEEHERSYAHHHARRALEAKQSRRGGGLPAEARLEKERRREAKELERLASAAGIRLETNINRPSKELIPTLNNSKSFSSSSSLPTTTFSGSGFKKVGGWEPISNSLTTQKTHDEDKTFKESSSFSNVANVLDNSEVARGLELSASFKSSGFSPISRSRTNNRVVIGVTSEKEQQPREVEDTQADLSKTSNPTTGNDPTSQRTDEKSDDLKKDQNKLSTGGGQSKFAQIAARLKAQRAADDSGTRSSMNKASKPRPKGGVDSELERMLEDGF